jgi:ADP-ribose pyrophosphatase YjhB (NUDIX family)/DNA-binding XRE family transcriptional regulator
VEEPYSLFKNIKKARTSLDLSQKELAKRLGVSDKTVSAYETGRAIPPTPTLAKIAEITNTSIPKLLGIKDKDDKSEIAKRLKRLEEKIEEQRQSKPSNVRVKIDTFVGIVVVDEKNRIFLIKEEDKYRISLGRWNLPGGSVDGNESLVEAAKRETREETGCDVEIISLLGVYKCKKGKNNWIYTVFKGEVVDNGEGIIDPQVEKGKWFTKEEFLKLHPSKIVHPDMKLVYKIAIENKGLGVESVKYIDYDIQ